MIGENNADLATKAVFIGVSAPTKEDFVYPAAEAEIDLHN